MYNYIFLGTSTLCHSHYLFDHHHSPGGSTCVTSINGSDCCQNTIITWDIVSPRVVIVHPNLPTQPIEMAVCCRRQRASVKDLLIIPGTQTLQSSVIIFFQILEYSETDTGMYSTLEYNILAGTTTHPDLSKPLQNHILTMSTTVFRTRTPLVFADLR